MLLGTICEASMTERANFFSFSCHFCLTLSLKVRFALVFSPLFPFFETFHVSWRVLMVPCHLDFQILWYFYYVWSKIGSQNHDVVIPILTAKGWIRKMTVGRQYRSYHGCYGPSTGFSWFYAYWLSFECLTCKFWSICYKVSLKCLYPHTVREQPWELNLPYSDRFSKIHFSTTEKRWYCWCISSLFYEFVMRLSSRRQSAPTWWCSVFRLSIHSLSSWHLELNEPFGCSLFRSRQIR